jgi:hypothetical protein
MTVTKMLFLFYLKNTMHLIRYGKSFIPFPEKSSRLRSGCIYRHMGL